MRYFLIISAAFAQDYVGYTVGNNTFASLKTTDGRTVCAHTSLLEFPEIFAGRRMTLVELEPGDFPPSHLPGPLAG